MSLRFNGRFLQTCCNAVLFDMKREYRDRSSVCGRRLTVGSAEFVLLLEGYVLIRHKRQRFGTNTYDITIQS